MLNSVLGRRAQTPQSSGNLRTPNGGSRSTTPTNRMDEDDAYDDMELERRTGTLTVRVASAQGLTLPHTAEVPEAVQSALGSREGQLASFVSPSSIRERQRLATQQHGHTKRQSVQRKNAWFMPYIVVEYDVNQVLVDALGGSDLFNPVYMHSAQFDVSRTAQLSIQIYLRRGDRGARRDMGDDIFMGAVKFFPNLDSMGAPDEWRDVLGGTGQIKLGFSFKPLANRHLNIDDFELLKVIGKGSFGKVMQVRKKDTARVYALKTLRKAHIASRNEITHTLAERFVLAKVNNPFIVPLKFSFQSEAKLYLVLSFVNGGELFYHLQQEQRFSEERSRFYCAELLLALEHLHGFNVVYRDLKPENVLLDWTGHLALCDFGLCKLDMTDDKTASTFCGTPEYLSPEIILGQAYSKTIDWWTLGILFVTYQATRLGLLTVRLRLYEMMSGLPPFYDENTDKMYEKIVNKPLVFTDFFGAEAKSILKGLLTREPSQRLGARGADEIKRHPFFSKRLDFKKLLAKQIQPPFKPNVTSAIDTANFDVVFTSELPYDSVVEASNLSETVQARFTGFSYDGSNISPH